MGDPLFVRDELGLVAWSMLAGAAFGVLVFGFGHTCPTVPSVEETVVEVVPDPVFVAEVTAYSPRCKGCTRYMYNGERPDPTKRTVAAHLPAWPIGSCVELLLPDAGWTVHTVTDTGAAIDTENKFDLLLPSQRAAKKWGRRQIAARKCA
jgi:3D (Asp-Asp-Asp) domain-containing protein